MNPTTAPAPAPATAPRQLLFETLWWAFTLVLASLLLLPVYSAIPDFPYFLANFVYIVVAITLTRYLFLLHLSWMRDRLLLQGLLSLALIPLIFWMGQYYNYFITYLDENGPDVFVKNLDPDVAGTMNDYLYNEYCFFGIWAIIAAFITPFRMLYNIWVRYRAGVKAL